MRSASAENSTIAERVTWHSPLPYLFGGLAAMLSLIAFALVILACSYWNLSRQNEDHDLETGAAGDDAMKIDGGKSSNVDYDEKVLVIMAGNQNPTFLATPVKVSSGVEIINGEGRERKAPENCEKSNKEMESNSHEREVMTEANTAPLESRDQ